MNLLSALIWEKDLVSPQLNLQYSSFCYAALNSFINLNSVLKKRELLSLVEVLGRKRVSELASLPSFSAVLRYILDNSVAPDVLEESYLLIRVWLSSNSVEGERGTSGCDTISTLGGCSTIIDLDAGGVWEHLDAGITQFNGYDGYERKKVLSVLDGVARVLDSLPVFSDFIASHTNILFVRKSPERPNVGSSTNFLRIGEACLRNIEYAEGGAEYIVDLILHESIHNYLGKFEVTNGTFVANRSLEFVESPWSGNIIPIQAYTQACYVWYGLWEYYKKLNAMRPSQFYSSKMAQAKLGIIKGLRVEEYEDQFSDQFLSDIAEIEHRVVVHGKTKC